MIYVSPQILEIFLVDILKTTFWMENLTQRWTQLGPFFLKSAQLFRFSEKNREVKYPASTKPPLSWKMYPEIYSKIILFAKRSILNIWQCSEYFCFDNYTVICKVNLCYLLHKHIQNSGIFRTLFIQVYAYTFKHIQHNCAYSRMLRHY